MDRSPGQEALDELYWRAEILQVMYWLAGESLAEEVGSGQLAEFLVADEQAVARHVHRLATEGYLDCISEQPRRYRLTDIGRREGGQSFADEFADMMRRGHGECSPGCACHTLGPEACEARAAHRH